MASDWSPRSAGSANWPIFVLSAHRSGSTLLRYLLDTHSRLACPPESKFIAGLEQLFHYPQVQEALAGMGVPPVEFAKELRLFVNRVMGRYARQVNKPRWVDKTPNYYRYTRFIDVIFDRQVHYIVLARHPLDCIGSLEAYIYPSPQHPDPEIARSAQINGSDRYAWAQYWVDVYSRLHAFASSCTDRAIIVRYEDIVSAPQAALQRMLTFVGERYEPGMVERALRIEHAPGYGDQKIARTTAIHQHGVGRWKTWPRTEVDALWQTVGPLATRFGYAVDTPTMDTERVTATVHAG